MCVLCLFLCLFFVNFKRRNDPSFYQRPALCVCVCVHVSLQSTKNLTTSEKPMSVCVCMLISGVLRNAARQMQALIHVASITVTRLGPAVMSSGAVMWLGFTVFPPRLCDTLGPGNWSQRGQ